MPAKKNKMPEAQELIEFHERSLFLRAYPANKKVLRQAERTLERVESQAARLRKLDADLSPLDEPEVSGIAGTSVTSNFSYALVRWLVAKYPNQISIDWDWFENEDQFGTTMPRFLPLLEEDAMVEAHVPYRDWLNTARGRRSEVAWIIEQVESLRVNDKQRAELYDSLRLHISWRFGFRSSRTGMKLPLRKVFFHDQPLIRRRDISLAEELNSPPIPIQKLSRTEGEKILDLARETSAVRYRELHGFTYGDPRRGIKADLGRGTEAFVYGVSPEYRLPLRAYHAAIIFKNGVPVAYFEGLSLFERMESGFNLYYTFRDGETAWLYARILRLMRQLLGVTVFSIDPYQIGHENEEGIASGAFWFYRKLGFRPVRPELLKLARTEEKKIARNPRHRTKPATLRKLAAGPMLFDTQTAAPHDWDRFEIRNIGLAVQRRMANEFNSDPKRIRTQSAGFVRRALRLRSSPENDRHEKIFDDLALVFAMIPELPKWSREEKELARKVITAKTASDESLYLKQMQGHTRMRAAVIALGSKA